ncbi:MAG: type II toxin-antitoxin system HicB family antitoxin [Terriglobia bacterium]|jgi:predicted RNase H-like HicB family nuclease
MRQVIIYPGEDGYWVVECPSLPGCISQGKTREEAIQNIKEAIRGYVAALEADGLPVPAPCHADPSLREKHLALLFVDGKVQSAMLRGVYPERSERAQHDSGVHSG